MCQKLRERERELIDNMNLNSTVVFVVSEAEGAECAVHTIQTVHVALALVRISVKLALNEEALFQQRLQPRRPPVVLVIGASRTLFEKSKFESDPESRRMINCIFSQNKKKTVRK